MFVLVLAVPGLLVVVLGYVVGHALVDWLDGLTGTGLPAGASELGGWITGLLLLAAVTALFVLRPRRPRRGGDGGHQK